VNPRALNPCQLAVLLFLARSGPASCPAVLAGSGCGQEGQARQALRSLVCRGLAEAGSWDGGRYAYRLTGAGTDCAARAGVAQSPPAT
jgi:hypothetical protein